jgi:hypothetical protein
LAVSQINTAGKGRVVSIRPRFLRVARLAGWDQQQSCPVLVELTMAPVEVVATVAVEEREIGRQTVLVRDEEAAP